MKITIGGMPGSGKSVVGKFLAEKLGYEFYSIGNIRRELAKKRGLTIMEYNELKENTDSDVDEFQKDMGRNKKDFVLEGRLSFNFVPDSLKLYFDCDLHVSAERVFNATRDTEDKGSSPDDTYANLKARLDNDRKRYKKYYKLDAYDKTQFDYVIDTTDMPLEEVKDVVLKIIKKEMGSV